MMNNKPFTLFFSSFLAFILSVQISSAQADCCAGFFLGNFQSYCIANLDPCNGTTCSQATLEAAHGLSGAWGSIQCTGGAPDCSVSCVPGNIAGGGMPVEMVSFEVDYNDDAIELHWSTASEIDNEGFEIEHSADGVNWEYMDFVEGNGTTDRPQDYFYKDQSPKLGFNYYRLKQMDYDGDFEYSPTKVAIWQGTTDREKLEMAVLPNPATTWMTAALPNTISKEKNIQFQIFDQIGRLVKTIVIAPEEQIRIDLDELPSGFYILNASQNNFQYSTSFIKK